ncbi:MAG: chromosome segregation protein SMC [Bacillota bacterium]
MYLKRVEIFGFKSFAEKTELEFTPGITAVVGPNGSGKSNVSDAIRWVLGEQSARALRGGQMADVIFAGSDGKRAMGFAQVSLVLDNSDGKLGMGFTEVMVTRRVDRSGEGEYFINQVPCRLKDVHDLFLDTGVGKENYSIIGQGKIDEILSSKPEDRRALFEEAAGIARYKARKREAQRRLEETEQNLLRITDIITELSGNMESLAEQARKAEIYTGLDAELTRLDVGLLAHQLSHLSARLQKQLELNAELSGRAQEIEAKMQAGEEAAEVVRQLVEALDEELSVLSVRLAEATGRLERAEGRLALSHQEERSVQLDQQRILRESEAVAAKRAAVATELANLAEQVAAVEQNGAQLAEKLAALEEGRREVEAESQAAQAAVEERKARIVAILQLEAERKNGALGADRAADEAGARLSRLAGERERAEADAAQTREQVAAKGAEQVALEAERVALEAELVRLRSERQDSEQKLQELQQQGSAVREAIQAASSRLGTIEEMINAFEGYQKGTRTVLQGREKGAPWAAEVLGTVAEVIRTEPRYEKAVEIALGGAIQNLITATDTGAKQAIEHLKRSSGGRATFLPLNTIRPNGYRPDEEREFAGAPGIIGVALDLVRFEERFRPAIASLLGRTLIAEDMDAALAFGRKTGQRYRVVTLDGELLAPGGALTGGSTGGQGAGLLSREREREELSAKIAELKQELAAARQAYEAEQGRRSQIAAQVQERESALRAVETKITQAEAEANRLTGEIRRWEQLLQTHAQQAAAIEAEVAERRAQAEALRAELTGLAAERQGLEAEVAQLIAEGQARAGALAERQQAVTGLQVKLAELHEQLRGLSGQRARLGAEATALEAEEAGKQAEQAALAERIEQIAADLVAARQEAEEAGQAKRALEEERGRVQARKLEAMEQSNARDREMRTLRRSQTETQNKLQAGEVEEARLKLEQENLVSRLQEQYGLTPADVVELALPEGEIEFARARIHELREQIRELGPVNLAAIEDYRIAQERLAFLTGQQGDLEEAKGSLYRAIEELDKRIKSHFVDSFHVIRREFQRVYQELFEGGKADLVLVDENDLLETGIEIIAQPPGKKPQTLSLLSGGERAMTAIALLFALLRVKPTPFVVLDEVEAALDEANVERFGKYLRNYAAGGSQFICITHQRGTMEVADALYGVTMEGTGVSKVVSVRLVDLEREAS